MVFLHTLYLSSFYYKALVPPEQEALHSFRLIDEEHKGHITKTQFHKLIDPLKDYIDIPAGRLDEIFNTADKDGDHVLNYEEFKHAFLKTMQ